MSMNGLELLYSYEEKLSFILTILKISLKVFKTIFDTKM